MTPREKVARALDPDIWADELPVPTRADVVGFHARRQASIGKADDILTALTSGSGDHAELARLAEAAEANATPLNAFNFRTAANPATVLALIAENAALRGEIDDARTIDSGFWKWLAQRDLQPDGPDAEWGDIVVALTEHETNAYDIADKASDRATEAERKLAEARTIIDEGLYARTDKFEAMARTFLSSTEAERG